MTCLIDTENRKCHFGVCANVGHDCCYDDKHFAGSRFEASRGASWPDAAEGCGEEVRDKEVVLELGLCYGIRTPVCPRFLVGGAADNKETN